MTIKYLKPLVFIVLTLAFASCVKEPNKGNPNVIGENETSLIFEVTRKKIKENSKELQKPNLEAEIYDNNKKCEEKEKKKSSKA